MTDSLLTLREYARLAPWNIRDLATLAGGILDASGITPTNAAAQTRPSDRTIRFYVTRRMMSGPEGRGTAATYGYRHLLQVLAIKLRQMEGATLTAIAKELGESPGDVLEKRVATALGSIPGPQDLDYAERGAPRGRVARELSDQARRSAATDGPAAASGAWYRVALGDGAELVLRADHPAARTGLTRQRAAEAAARAVREAAAGEDAET